MTVEQIIGDLLLQHNCVVVPAFGGFVAQRVGAQLDTVRGTMLPPRKAILFNRQLINNDGLLIASYAHHNKVDFTAAQQTINDAVLAWESNLKNGQRIAIDRVGFLYLDAERNLCFEQDRFYNLLLESYGLGPVHFVSAADVEAKTAHDAVQEMVREVFDQPAGELNSKQPVLVAVEEPRKLSEAVVKKAPVIPIAAARKNNAWKYVAAAVFLPVAFYSFWIPMKTDVLQSGVLSLSDFNPFRKQEVSRKAPEKAASSGIKMEEPVTESTNTEDLPVNESAVQETQPEVTAAQPNPSKPVQQSYPAGSQVIAGCFSNASNAEKFVETLKSKGYDAKILPGERLTRVSAGNGADFDSLKNRLAADGFSAWLLK